jgi:hypothetical protein
MMCLKVAIVLDWMAIFLPVNHSRRAFYWASVTLIVVISAWYICNRIAQNFHCIPHQRIWDLTVAGACYDWKVANLITGVINLVSDIVLFALPHSVIWNLNLPKSKKVGVSVIFAAGLL